jgi:PhnB protein
MDGLQGTKSKINVLKGLGGSSYLRRNNNTEPGKKKIMTNNAIVQSYLFFDGRCEEAIEFYKKALGAQVNLLMRFKDSPEPPPPGCGPRDPNKVMHAQFQIGSTTLMASDGRASGKPKFEGVALSLSLPTEADVDQAFAALAAGGKVEMPLAKTFFSAKFGMVEDKFGVFWMVLVTPNSAE